MDSLTFEYDYEEVESCFYVKLGNCIGMNTPSTLIVGDLNAKIGRKDCLENSILGLTVRSGTSKEKDCLSSPIRSRPSIKPCNSRKPLPYDGLEN